MELSVTQPALPPRLRLIRRIVRRNESGAALLEFSLVFGLFVFILYGLIAFGMMLAVKQSITAAAAEGARSVVGVADNPLTVGTDERVEQAKSTVAQRLNWLGGNYVPASDLTVGTPFSCNGKTCITVKITYHYTDRPLVPPAPGLNLVTPDTFASEATVQIA